jgi:integrase
MSIKYRNGKYQCSVRRKGFKYIYKTFIQKSDAIKWQKQIEVEMQQNSFRDISNASKTTLKSVLERHLNERIKEVREPAKIKSRFNTLCKSNIVNLFLSQLSPNIFAEYRDKRIKSGISPSTIIKELCLFSVAIKRAMTVYNCWLPENPVLNSIKPKENLPRNRRLEEGEFDKLMIACKNKFNQSSIFWCSMIEFSIETATRLNEQLTLLWQNISFDKMTIRIESKHSKNGSERFIPMTPRVIEILKSLPRSIDGRLFPYSNHNFNRSWRSICRLAGINNLRWHDLRREGCSRLLEKGLSVSEVQMFTGHKTLSLMLNIYSVHNSVAVAKKLNK